MNICGCLAHVVPDQADTAAQTMRDTPGVEVHAQSDDGRFVVVVEDTPDRLASEIIMDLHQIPGVISLTLTYHHFEDLAESAPHPEAPSQTTSRRLTL
jgi:nitrate reductase NapD